MYKIISALPLVFLIGCATITTPSSAAFQPNKQLSQRDLQNPATTPPYGGFVANAWLLLQSETDPAQYAIAIRGTVGEAHSIIADTLITTTAAQSGITLNDGRLLPITFAATPQAELHLGFAYAAFTMLFEKDLGILRQLRDAKLPDNAKLFITGHSQGAAIATLVHSFLYYAIT